jgi:hypothetical protein
MQADEPRERAGSAHWVPTSDPIIYWPGESGSLAAIIPDLVRLNPSLELRLVLDEDEDGEFLSYAGSALDVVTIALPQPLSDQFYSDLTDLNKDWMGYDTEIGEVRVGPRRFERTANGDLLLRPKSWATVEASTRFSRAFQGHSPLAATPGRMPQEQIGRIQKYWAIFHDPYEMWETEYAYMPADLFDRVGQRTNEEYWRITPVGTICYIDQYDLPIEEHHRRAREIVKAGSEFAIVGDMQTGELRVFRVDGVQNSFEDIRVPEMPWFDVPAPKLQR